jgi:hypothetical protein
MSESYTLKTRELLDRHGIRCVEGRGLVPTGKNPDLFCVEPCPFWVEVKYIERPQAYERLAPLMDRLGRALNELDSSGSIFVHVSNTCDDVDVKLAKKALKLSASRKSEITEDYRIFVVQEPRIKDQFVEFKLKTSKGNALVISTKSASGHYGLPVGHMPRLGMDYLELTEAGRNVELLDVCRLDTSARKFRIALVITPDSRPLRISGSMPADDLFPKSNREKIRDLFSAAMPQFKNALQYRDAPCLLVVWQDAIFASGPADAGSAVYGNWKRKFAPTRPDLGVEHVYEEDAAFACGKNTTVSALCYIPVGGEPLTFHNFFAARKLPMGLLPGVECAPRSDGSIEVPQR